MNTPSPSPDRSPLREAVTSTIDILQSLAWAVRNLPTVLAILEKSRKETSTAIRRDREYFFPRQYDSLLMLSSCCNEHLALEQNETGFVRSVCKACGKVEHGQGLFGSWHRLPEPKDE